MPDDFRKWGLLDVQRLAALIGVELAWLRDLRHSQTEGIENEKLRTRELSDALLEFNNTRLAQNGGSRWGVDRPPLALLDEPTVVHPSFVAEVMEQAVPSYGDAVRHIQLDSKYWLPTQRDAWRIIEWSQVNTIPWQRELYDCDDHAEALRHDFRTMGFNSCAFVLDWAGHCYNLIVFADGQYWFVEPGNDGIVTIGSGIYELANGIIML